MTDELKVRVVEDCGSHVLVAFGDASDEEVWIAQKISSADAERMKQGFRPLDKTILCDPNLKKGPADIIPFPEQDCK